MYKRDTRSKACVWWTAFTSTYMAEHCSLTLLTPVQTSAIPLALQHVSSLQRPFIALCSSCPLRGGMTMRYVQADFECKECGCRRWTSRAPSAAPAPTRIRSIIKKDEHVDYTLHEGETAQGVKYYEARHTHGCDLQRNRWRRTVRCSRAEGGPGVGFRFGLDLGFN